MTSNQEKALAALLTCSTVKAAAAQCGMTAQTLHKYLKDAEFKRRYDMELGKLCSNAKTSLQQTYSTAAERLKEIIEDRDTNAAVAVQACRTVFEYGIKLTELTDVVQRLDELERRFEGG